MHRSSSIRLPLLFSLLSLAVSTLAQNVQAPDAGTIQATLKEGRLLYRLEMAAWYGTDLFLKKFKSQAHDVGGYITYPSHDRTICVIVSKEEPGKALATINFDSTYKNIYAKIDGSKRELTSEEKDLTIIRQKSMDAVANREEFPLHEYTSQNLIPIIDEHGKRVYVLTGAKANGIVVFGGDHLLHFDTANNLLEHRKLHKSTLVLDYGQESQQFNVQAVGSVHNHMPETGDLITATDICTLLLYERFTSWKTHYVFSQKYVSIWDCHEDSLNVLTREAFEKSMVENQGTRKAKSRRN